MRPNTVIEPQVDRKDRFFIKDHEEDNQEQEGEVKQVSSQLDEPSMISDLIVVPSARDIYPQQLQQIDLKDLIDISKLSIEPIEEDEEHAVINIQEIYISLPANSQSGSSSQDQLNSCQQIKPPFAFASSPPEQEYSEVYHDKDHLEESKLQEEDAVELYNQFSNLESR